MRSVSFHLHNTQKEHIRLRIEAVNWIRKNWVELRYHIFNFNEEMGDQRNYCYNIRQDKTYGTSTELVALSEVYKTNKIIHHVVAGRPILARRSTRTATTM